MIHLKRLGIGLLFGLLVACFYTVAMYFIEYHPSVIYIVGITAILYCFGAAFLSSR